MDLHASKGYEARGFAEKHYDEVFRYCHRHVASAEDAQDLTQETFLRFVRSSSNYQDKGKPLAYLFTIARNLCIDHHRAHPPACELIDEETADPVDDHGTIELDGLLGQLPIEEREMVELRFDQGLQINEIAEVTGISRFSVRRRLNKALGSLRSMMQDMMQDNE